MTLENMKIIANENNGTIPAGIALTMTDLEVRKAIKHGYLKEDPKKAFMADMKKKEEKDSKEEPEKVQSPEPKKKATKKTPEAESKDSDNTVITTPASLFSKEQKDTYSRLDSLIYDRMNDMKKSSFDIAFALHVIYENGYFKIDGYKNIYDYARERYGIARGTTNNFINLVDRFADLKNQKTLELRPEFSDYSSTQLICMLGHTDDELKEKNITPSMSSREIKKALKDSGNNANAEAVNSLNGGSSSASKNSDAEPDAEDCETAPITDPCFNIVLDFSQYNIPAIAKDDGMENEVLTEILLGKVKVISKLLKMGHGVQIIDILP